MSDILSGEYYAFYLLPLLLVVSLLSLLLIYRRRALKGHSLAQVLNEIAFERVDKLVIPNTHSVNQLLT